MKAAICVLLAGLAGLLAVPAQARDSDRAPLKFSAAGEVHRAGTFALPAHARFSDAVLAAMPTPDAYLLAAAVYREQAAREQAGTKAGLLFDLDLLAKGADGDPAWGAQLSRLRSMVESMPVTGRVSNPLEPRRLEIDPEANMPLAAGDRFVFPRRPSTVRVSGAVVRDCVLPHVPQQDAPAYLRHCSTGAGADREALYVIQPDGRIDVLGVALWNRSETAALAPGAILYVPFAAKLLGDAAPSFNAEMAAFIATQPVAEVSP